MSRVSHSPPRTRSTTQRGGNASTMDFPADSTSSQRFGQDPHTHQSPASAPASPAMAPGLVHDHQADDRTSRLEALVIGLQQQLQQLVRNEARQFPTPPPASPTFTTLSTGGKNARNKPSCFGEMNVSPTLWIKQVQHYLGGEPDPTNHQHLIGVAVSYLYGDYLAWGMETMKSCVTLEQFMDKFRMNFCPLERDEHWNATKILVCTKQHRSHKGGLVDPCDRSSRQKPPSNARLCMSTNGYAIIISLATANFNCRPLRRQFLKKILPNTTLLPPIRLGE